MPSQTILKLYFRSWLDVIALLQKPILLVPLLIFALLRLVALLSVTFFAYPPFAHIAVPAIRSVFGEESLRYPQHILMLPDMYQAIDISMWLVFGSTLLGWSVFIANDILKQRRAGGSQHALQALWSVPSFLLVGVLLALVVFGVPFLYDKISELVEHKRVLQLLLLSSVSLWVFVVSFLVYSFFFLKHGTVNAATAIKESMRFALRRFSLTTMIVLTGLVVYVPGYFFMTALATPHVGESDPLLRAVLLKVLFDTLALYYLVVATTSVAAGRRREA